MVLKELADLGFVIAFRFYGRYPETGRSFYHPPPCECDRLDAAEASTLPASENVRRRSPARRSGLATATSLILPSLSAPNLAELFSSGTFQNLDGVLPSPALQTVGPH